MSSLLRKTISAIDIGTTKICVLVASVDAQGGIDIIGVGHCPSYGMKKGVIVNVTLTVDSIKKALTQAEEMAGIKIESVAVGISGGHISSFNSKGVVAIRKSDVTQDDIDRVIDAAKAVPIPQDREILHVIPQYFRVDNQDYVQDSIGMFGVRLEVQVHIVTGAVSSAQNIIKSCELAGVRVKDIVLEQVASADAVLSRTEKELGVGILDIGGGTSDFAIYKDGHIRHSKVFAVAGNHFTQDLAIGCGVPIDKAEELKRAYGFVIEEKYLELACDTIELDLPENEKKVLDTYALYEILNPRAEEIFELLDEELKKYRLRGFMPAGLVLTGGGSLLRGMKELAEAKLGVPVRIGIPRYFSQEKQSQANIPDLLKSPIYSTGYGLLMYAAQQSKAHLHAHSGDSLFGKVFKRMKSWIYDFI